MNKSKEEIVEFLFSGQNEFGTFKHQGIGNCTKENVLEALTTHSQNKEAEIRMDERESIKRKLTSLPMMNNETPEKRATTYWLNVEHVMEALTPPPESPEVLKD